MAGDIVFWGAKGHAKVLRDLVERLGYRLVATFDNNLELPPPFADVPMFYGINGFQRWRASNEEKRKTCLVAIGGASGRDRHELQCFMESQGLVPAVAVHPTAFVASTATLAKGCQVLAHSTVCADTKIGEATIINTGASIDHETTLGKGVHVGPGAILTGCVSVGDYTFIGAGAVVLPNVRIGADVVVGAGALVTKNIPDGKVAYGSPARIIRDNG